MNTIYKCKVFSRFQYLTNCFEAKGYQIYDMSFTALKYFDGEQDKMFNRNV